MMKKICVIGSYSGRNAGDAAILENLLRDIYAIHRDVEFLVPTINKKFIDQTYGQFPVKAVPMMPWNLSLKIFGLPVFRAVLHSDLVLLTDAILFDHKLWNPVFNFLSTMAMVLPLAKRKGIPVVLYNASLGPIKSALGKWCFHKVIESMDLLIVRDTVSIEVLRNLNIQRNDIKVGADCALNTPLPGPERMAEIKNKEGILQDGHPYISINVNDYVDAFVKGTGNKRLGREGFTELIAEVVDKVIEEISARIIFVVTQVLDIRIVNEVIEKMQNSEKVKIITNKIYSHNELSGVLAEVDMHVGMRTHSLILATASCTPSISIVYRPKNRGYMRTIEQEDRSIEIDHSFNSKNLYNLIHKTWKEKDKIKHQLGSIVEREKKKAKSSAFLLGTYLNN